MLLFSVVRFRCYSSLLCVLLPVHLVTHMTLYFCLQRERERERERERSVVPCTYSHGPMRHTLSREYSPFFSMDLMSKDDTKMHKSRESPCMDFTHILNRVESNSYSVYNKVYYYRLEKEETFAHTHTQKKRNISSSSLLLRSTTKLSSLQRDQLGVDVEDSKRRERERSV